jgi:hypothetical protein
VNGAVVDEDARGAITQDEERVARVTLSDQVRIGVEVPLGDEVANRLERAVGHAGEERRAAQDGVGHGHLPAFALSASRHRPSARLDER